MTFPYDTMLPDNIDKLKSGMSIMVAWPNPDNKPDGILEIRSGNYYIVVRSGDTIRIHKDDIITRNSTHRRR